MSFQPSFSPVTRHSVPTGRRSEHNQTRALKFSAEGNPPPEAPKTPSPQATQTIGQGQTLAPTEITIEKGKLSLIRKEQSTANLKRDIWMVEDEATGQKYSAFVASGDEGELVALYEVLASWGEGSKVRAQGIASKPMSMQRFPFLMLESIEKIPTQ
ncbi:MAG: hypothetical protein K2X66_06285 [Cyanobacteria bacterium]|nr:hypothetical protein [Cyanobacteriota bacterium]